ncbi:MAG: hypothetical protein GF368_03865 [Candidatus Aenigmarchaeota archaeon]|nr:hypothetical protein [Candidatus Aenigmarchaeota archaeon]
MIFVTVGTHTKGFDRLFKEIDRLVSEDKIKDKFFVEVGKSDYRPENYEYTDLLPFEKYKKMISEADLVISHGGLGSVINVLEKNKKLVVVPRRKEFDEHVDDHQLQIAKVLEKRERAIPVYDIKNLEGAIKKAEKSKMLNRNIGKENKIIEVIENYIEENNR